MQPPAGKIGSQAYRAAAGATTCVWLIVGTCRGHSGCKPFSSRTCSRYLPSGASAARYTWPLLVRFSMEKCSKGTCWLYCKKEYTPNTAAAITTITNPAVRPAPNLFFRAASTITEPLDLTRSGVASDGGSWVVGASGRAIQRIGYRNNPTPVNRNTNEETTRTRGGLTLKNSAKPPQTPAIFLSVLERVKRFSPLTGAVAALAEGAGVGAGAAGILVDDDVAATPPETISRCTRFRSPPTSPPPCYPKSRPFSP